MRYLVIVILFFSTIPDGKSQLVNVESKRLKSDTTGWLGNFGAAFELQKATSQVVNISAQTQLEYKAKKDLYLLLLNYELLKGEGLVFQNDLFYHFRYNRKVTPWLRWEAFNQIQNNNVTGIDVRFLLGTGPRFKVADSKTIAFYAATAVMYENEKEVNGLHHKDIRSSSYISATWKPSETTDVISSFFYQPLFKDLSDFRILHELKLQLQITKKFSFFTEWNLLFDSNPVVTIPKETYKLKNGILFKF